jgi:hypothetical protein
VRRNEPVRTAQASAGVGYCRGQPRTNTLHHPEKLLHTDDDDEEK